MNLAVRPLAVPRSRRAVIVLGAAVFALLVVVRLGSVVARSAPSEAPTAAQTIDVPPPLLTAHGVVQPVARANVASLSGGSILELRAQVGQTVDKGQLLARVAGATQTETVVAPWSGTVISVPVHLGDSVPPGTTLLSLADPSRYQVETTDVDEYLIQRIRTTQAATVTFDALPERSVRGTVVSVAAQAQPAAGGTLHYPTIINLPGAVPELRPGMTVHIVFDS
jgi:multidrug efflux pump subunit AcrA (membrane-fusion protein)